MDCVLVDKRRKSLKSKLDNYKEILFEKSDVVMMTCVSSGSYILNKYLQKRKTFFDLVIIDEASQAIEAAAWIPLLLGKKLIMSGDQFQIGPLIASSENFYELSTTLFDKIYNIDKIDKTKDLCRMLTTQYRMNAKIMEFSSRKWYSNQLVASENVANKTMKDKVTINMKFKHNDSINNTNYNYNNNNYNNNNFNGREINLNNLNLNTDFDPLNLLSEPLIFVDTKGQFSENRMATTKINDGEANIVAWFVKYLTDNKVNPEDIGIITPYSGQVLNIRQKVGERPEVSSVDGFQGREKEVIIISFVRSNNASIIGFLSDEKRINVSLTRAQKMLIIICDSENMLNDKFLKEMILFYKANSYIFDSSKCLNKYK